MDLGNHFYYDYFKVLDKSLLRKKEFHLFFSTVDIAILLFKILNIYHSNYYKNFSNIHKYVSPSLFLRDYSIFTRLLPIIIYLLFVYLILIVYLLYINNKRINKLDMIIINIF